MTANQNMAVDNVTVIIPNGVFGAVQQYKNHDPKRIQQVHITAQQVQLQMTKVHYEQALAEFEEYLYHFQQQIAHDSEDVQYSAYERVEYSEDYRTIRFYLTADQYFQHRFLEINELELVIDALYYQLYKGVQPSVTFEYVDVETHSELGKMSYP